MLKKEQVRGMKRIRRERNSAEVRECGGWVWLSMMCPFLVGLRLSFDGSCVWRKERKLVPQQHESSNQRPVY